MNKSVEYCLNKTSEAKIAELLRLCNFDFVPPLSERVEISDYAHKIAHKALRFEAWSGEVLVGLVAAYCNDQQNRIAYITSVSVRREWTGKGIAGQLMTRCIEHAKASGMWQISLEVASGNASAIRLYEKNGFIAGNVNSLVVSMHLHWKTKG